MSLNNPPLKSKQTKYEKKKNPKKTKRKEAKQKKITIKKQTKYTQQKQKQPKTKFFIVANEWRDSPVKGCDLNFCPVGHPVTSSSGLNIWIFFFQPSCHK